MPTASQRRREALKALERQRLVDLRASGELLRQAEEIRALVARVGMAVQDSYQVEIPEAQLARWQAWALAQADALDPVLSEQVLTHLMVPELDAGHDDDL